VTTGLFLGALALVLAGALRARVRRSDTPSEAAQLPPQEFLVALLCALATALFLAQLRVIEIASATQVPFPHVYAGLPVVPLDESAPAYGHTPPWVTTTILGLTIAETGALFALYRSLRKRRPTRATAASICIACAIMLAGALRTSATTSGDMYLYVGFAHLGTASYAPPAVPFKGEFAVVNRLWGLPMLPAAYGPVWIGLSRLTLLAGHSLGTQVEAFRLIAAISFCASASFLFLLRREPATAALFALNPALLEQYVADGHNDIFCLALTLAAFLAVRSGAVAAAIVLVAAAGTAKLPFALVGALAFASLARPSRRIGSAALAIGLALGATDLFSGGRYAAAATHVMRTYAFSDPSSAVARLVVAAVALGALLMAVALRRFNCGASWSFLAFGTELFPWYVAWGVPYALLEGSWLTAYLLSLPLVAFNLTTVYAPTVWSRAGYGILLLAPLLPLVLLLRDRREARNASRRTPGL
jgi:hypothetical protein